MNEVCKTIVKEADKLLATPDKHSFAHFAEQIYEQGYVAGMAMARRLLRLKLGLSVPSDEEGV